MITAADDYVGDVFIENERISLIGESLDVDADKVIDAAGKYDPTRRRRPAHHLDMPFGGTVTIDDVEDRANGGRVRWDDLPRRLRDPAPGRDLRGGAGRVALEGQRQAGDRHGLPHGDHGLRGGLARRARRAAGARRHLLQAVHGLQGALMVDDETLFRSMQVAADSGAP